MSPVKLTVLMPAFNAERYIAAAVESVLAQTFTDFELVIVDDGSTDGTGAVIRHFMDPRIVLIHQEHGGIAAALNKGLQASQAPLVARFDADDVCYPDRLEKQVRFMEQHPDFILAGSMVDYTDMDGRYVFTHRPLAMTHESIRALPLRTCPFIHSSVIYRKDYVNEQGAYNPMAHGFEDHFLWRSLINQGKVCNLPEVLMMVRFSPGSVTMDETCRSAAYLSIKYEALRHGTLSPEQGQRLQDLIRDEEVSGARKGAYHVLLAKKYLWNNAQPRKAREHAREILSDRLYRQKGYTLLLLSYLPSPWLYRMYRLLNRMDYAG
jgi:glycosyltransferase involved in cell wall biosynthesis